MLPDGRYDALVVDAVADGDGAMSLEVTLLDGPHKGEVVTLTARGLDRDEADLLAVPATLTVAGGAPSITLEG